MRRFPLSRISGLIPPALSVALACSPALAADPAKAPPKKEAKSDIIQVQRPPEPEPVRPEPETTTPPTQVQPVTATPAPAAPMPGVGQAPAQTLGGSGAESVQQAAASRGSQVQSETASNVVSGGDGLGGWMTSHPVPRKISFTGSVATGKKVAAAAAPDLKRTTLELGGNDPAILLDDVDAAEVADRVYWFAFANNGQICSAIKRVYVPEAIYDDVVDALATHARAAKVGDGADPETQLGPINNRPQFERVSELVADALKGGARAAAGGNPIDSPGNFFAPHDIWIDSRGDVYVGEVVLSAGGNRGLVSPDCHALQKFVRRADG